MSSLRYIKLENETDEQQEKLNSLLNNDEYNYEESNDCLTFYARQFIDYWKDDIENDVRTAMKRIPKELTDEYLFDNALNTISDYEKDIMENISENAVNDFKTKDENLSNLGISMANNCYYIPESKEEVEAILDSAKNEFERKMSMQWTIKDTRNITEI